jgi:hypothetical protein
VFSKNELVKVALQKSFGEVHIDNLESTLNQFVENGLLQAVNKQNFTTKEAIDFEEKILNTVKAGKNMLEPLLTSSEAEKKLAVSSLTQGEKEACQLIVSTRDRFVMIQGYAGTGKTTMTKTAIDTLNQVQQMTGNNLEIIAVAPTHQAVKEMKALGIKAQTLKSFLIENEQELRLTPQSLVLLDESSMVCNRESERLFSQIHTAGARGVLLGDIAQHQSIESGKPSALLLKEGSIEAAWMSDIVRQQVIAYREAVETLVKGNTDLSLTQLSRLPLPPIERKGGHIYQQLKSSKEHWLKDI